MRIAVLTSSRADYGIYLPLLKTLEEDSFFDMRLIVFGTHLSSFHGYTVSQIVKDGFTIDHKIEHIVAGDSKQAIATSMAIAFTRFTAIWAEENNHYDLVFCLGDRYEMFAAVSAASPFRIPFAHLHGGELTLGAIDNEFRHCLTIFSTLHFTATDAYTQRVAAIKGGYENIYTVGSLSLENIKSTPFISDASFFDRFGIDLSRPTLLVTYHPETVSGEMNKFFAEELMQALSSFNNYQIIVTMPNADEMGNAMRHIYEQWAAQRNNIILIENFGTQGYFTCLQRAKLVIGNSSSGIIEAASFGKYVVNIGNRQKGRVASDNVVHCRNAAKSIKQAIETSLVKGEYTGKNIYYRPDVTQSIITVLKNKWKH